MENINNKELQRFLSETEKAFGEYARELADGLDNKTISIDDIESMMINTLSRIKKGFMNFTQDRIEEEDKKKLK